MPRLSAKELDSRLRFEHEVAMKLRAPWLAIGAYRNAVESAEPKNAIPAGADGFAARVYAVAYRFQTLTGAGTYVSETVMVFDLLAGGNYPLTAPLVSVCSRPLPWGRHIGAGFVCLGPAWEEAKGGMLLAHLVVHVARLLNYDEPFVDQAHMNGSAHAYWRDKLHRRPLNPSLTYPVMPSDVTHGVVSKVRFGQLSEKTRFRVRSIQ